VQAVPPKLLEQTCTGQSSTPAACNLVDDVHTHRDKGPVTVQAKASTWPYRSIDTSAGPRKAALTRKRWLYFARMNGGEQFQSLTAKLANELRAANKQSHQ
jgi:hypothetical protein